MILHEVVRKLTRNIVLSFLLYLKTLCDYTQGIIITVNAEMKICCEDEAILYNHSR